MEQASSNLPLLGLLKELSGPPKPKIQATPLRMLDFANEKILCFILEILSHVNYHFRGRCQYTAQIEQNVSDCTFVELDSIPETHLRPRSKLSRMAVKVS